MKKDSGWQLNNSMFAVSTFSGEDQSSDRALIKAHEQNPDHGFINLLIDITRDVIEWILGNEHEDAKRIISNWKRSEALLLRRLAIHAIAEDGILMNADDKIKWLLNKNILFSYPLKHEVFRLIKKTYPQLSPEIKGNLIRQIKKGPEYEVNDKKGTIFNLLDWLLKIDQDNETIKEEIKRIKKERQDLKPQKYPDLNSWSSKVDVIIGGLSPINAEELGKKDPVEIIEWLLNYKGQPIDGVDREGVLGTIVKVIGNNFNWGWKLTEELEKRQKWETKLWSAILEGWQNACLSEEEWQKVLGFLIENEKLYHLSHALTDFLKYGTSKAAYEMPFNCLEKAEELSRKLWDAYQRDKDDDQESNDWLQMAINQPSGKLVEFWLYVLSRKYKALEKEWQGLPGNYPGMFKNITKGGSFIDGIGKTILTSRIHFLYALDPEWTKKTIIPLLDWNANQKRARQAWHGFLIWGRVDEQYLNEIIPFYQQTFSKISGESEKFQEAFCQHLASIVVYSPIDPLKDNWLDSFISNTTDDVRVQFTYSVGEHIPKEDQHVINLWNRWLSKYLSNRIKGIPVQLSEKEKEGIITWIIPLKKLFSEISSKICEMTPAPKNEFLGNLYEDLAKLNLTQQYPYKMAKLLNYLLSNTSSSTIRFACNSAERMVEELINTDTDLEVLSQICDSLSRLNCSRAQELKNMIKDKRNG